MRRTSKFPTFLSFAVLLGLLLGIIGCAGENKRAPSSVSETDSCFDLMLPLVDEHQTLRKGDWDVADLAHRELLDEDQWLAMKGDESWQKFISRENQSDEEREMAFVVLSMLKKRYPKAGEGRLRDRYRVLMVFCGR